MRDSLTVLAILVIGVLTAALVGPPMVDWDAHRASIERRLSDAAGTPVTVAGSIDLRLIPRPVLRLGGVAVGDGAGNRPRVAAAALEAELSLAALMSGQIQVVDAVLVRPLFSLVQGSDGGFGFGPPSQGTADRVAVDHLGIRDGTLDVAFADGRRAALTGIDLDGEATSLRGPAKAAGRVGGLAFRLNTGAFDGGRLRMKLHLDGAGDRASLDLDGTVSARPGGLGPGFEGTATAAGRAALDGTPAGVPWRVTAQLSADRDGARASGVDLRAGADLRAVIASGDGTAAYAAGPAPPRAGLRVRGAALDLDGLAVSPPASAIAPPQGLDLVQTLLRGIGDGASLASVPIRLDLAAAFDTATIGGQTALGTTATLGFGVEPGALLSFAVDGPAGSRFALDGRIVPGPPIPVAGAFGAAPAPSSAAFRGRVDLRAAELRRVAAWLGPAAPTLADGIAAVPARDLRMTAAVDASATGVAARDIDLHLDGSAFAGTASVTRPAGSGRVRVAADLSSDALDLDRVPDLTRAGAAWRSFDLDLALSARAVTLAASPAGPVTAGHVAARFTGSGGDARQDALSLALDVGGGRLDLQGSRDAAGARGDLDVSAPQVGPLADALAPMLPGPVAAGLRARSAALSPMEVTLRGEASAAADGTLTPTALALAGTVGGTRVAATLAPDGPASGAAAAARPVALAFTADAADGADLLRLLGVPARGAVAGAAHAAGSAKGTLDGGVSGTLDATLGFTTLSYAGRAGTAGGAGRLALRSADLGPALAAFGLPAPAAALPGEGAGTFTWDGTAADWHGLSARLGGADVMGDLSFDAASTGSRPALRGRLSVDRWPAAALFGLALGPPVAPTPGAAWSTLPFSAPPASLPRGELALAVGEMPLGDASSARDVALILRTGPGSVALTDIAGHVGGGDVGGTLGLRRDGSTVTASGRLAWDGVALDAAGLTGRTSGAMDLAGAGASPAALVASLAGTGRLAVSGAALARTDPDAPGRVLAAVTARDAAAERGDAAAGPTPPDAEALRREMAAALDRGPLAIGSAEAAAVLAGGTLRVGPLARRGAVPLPGRDGGTGGDADASLAVDVATLAVTTRARFRAETSAGGPAAGTGDVLVTRTGPLGGEAARKIDVSGLVEAVQARAIARAQDRIDVLEQDIRERAAFNRQFKAMQQRERAERERAEAERAAAAAAARAAAEARKQAAAEAQRQAADAQKAAAARVQAQVEAAARGEAAARAETEKQRDAAASPDPDVRAAPVDGLRSRARRGPRIRDRDPFDLPSPPSIVQERGAAP